MTISLFKLLFYIDLIYVYFHIKHSEIINIKKKWCKVNCKYITTNIFRVFTLCVKYKYFKIRHDEICKDCCNLFFVIYDIKGDVIKGIW
jgi:hypothetical protein